MSKLKKNITIIMIISLLVIALLNLDVPFKITSMAKVLPARQWILSRSTDGDILTNTINNLQTINNSLKLTSFERGESMFLQLNSKLNSEELVHAGDTLGVIYSSKKEENLIELKGELQVLNAQLLASLSGGKSADVKRAQRKLEMSESEYDKQLRIVDRSKKLFEKDLIAEEEYETEADELTILDKGVKVSRAELESCLSGDKVEEINMVKKKINSLETQISFLEKEINSQNTLPAPFAGRLERNFSNDTLLVLSDFEVGVALIPVTIKDANYFDKGAKVLFKLSDAPNSTIGVVQMKQPTMKIINGQQCIFVLAKVYNLSENFISGVISEVEIECGRIPFLEFIERTILI